jgi:hypothetical protein
MFTTGSRLFFGGAALTGALSFVYLFTGANGHPEVFGFWTLMTLCFVFVFLGGITIAGRDGDVAVATGSADVVAAAPASRGPWPAVGAFGLLLAALGLVDDKRIFLAGIAVIALATLEWTVAAWADRASADPAYNRTARSVLARPLEFSVLAALVGIFVVVGFSRILVAASEKGAVAIFAAFAAVIFIEAIVYAASPRAGKAVGITMLAFVAAAVLAFGIAGISAGERGFDVRTGPEKKASNFVSDKSSVVADLLFSAGSLNQPALTVPKGATLSLLFRNKDTDRRSLVLVTGVDSAKNPIKVATDLIGPDKATILTFKIAKAGKYDLTVVDDSGKVLTTGQVTVQ